MAKSVDLPVPACAMVEVDKPFIRQNPDLKFQLARASYMPPSGLQFGSRLLRAEGEMSRLLQHLNSSQQKAVEDQHLYTGITLFDLLLESRDQRQAIFIKHHHDVQISTTFVDFGHHFRGPLWIGKNPHPQLFQHSVRNNPKLWANSRIINHWLAQFRKKLPRSLATSISETPKEWYTGDIQKMQARYLQRIAIFESIVKGFVVQTSQSSVFAPSLPKQETVL